MSSPSAAPSTDSVEIRDERATKSWERFFKGETQRVAIYDAVLEWPAKRSLTVDWFQLHLHDRSLAEALLEHPYSTLAQAEEALKSVDFPIEPRPRIHVRITNLPKTHTLRLNELRTEHVGSLVSVTGIVRRASDIAMRVLEAIFQCGRCGCFVKEPQEEHLVLKEPLECYEDQGGCGRDSSFKLIVSETRGMASKFIDTQFLQLEDAPETGHGRQPARRDAWVEDDLCDVARAGQRVTLTGVVRCLNKKDKGTKTTIFTIFIEANSVIVLDPDDDQPDLTDEDLAEIKLAAGDAQLIPKMRASIAPAIWGLDVEKLSFALQLFGAAESDLDGTRMRGDIHVLIIGDPSVAKSRILERIAKLSIRSVVTSGKGASGAGLTAAVVQDANPFAETRWVLEAGAMPRADGGILLCDEFDKMEAEDRSRMHDGMEQQRIFINKASISSTLYTRCAVLAVMNPKDGRLDDYKPMKDQVDIPPSLLSRFDIIWFLRDIPNPDEDAAKSAKILDNHLRARLHRAKKHDVPIPAELAAEAPPQAAPYSTELLRKWIAYARHNCFPVLTKRALVKLQKSYLDERKRGEEGRIPLTTRQLEAAVRLSEAAARMRLSPEITEADADVALAVLLTSLNRVAGTDKGRDIDLVGESKSFEQRHAINVIELLVRDHQHLTPHGAPEAVILAEAAKQGIPEPQASAILARLINSVTPSLWSPNPGHYKRSKK